jgi:hypothetical protein
MSNAVRANVAMTSRCVGGVPPRWFPSQRYLGTTDVTAGTLSPERFTSVVLVFTITYDALNVASQLGQHTAFCLSAPPIEM